MGERLERMKKAAGKPDLGKAAAPARVCRWCGKGFTVAEFLGHQCPGRPKCRYCKKRFERPAELFRHECPKEQGIPVEERERRQAVKGRLPGGSFFECSWDGVNWYGLLSVPTTGDGHDNKTFEHKSSGVFRLLSELDDKYRAWLKENL